MTGEVLLQGRYRILEAVSANGGVQSYVARDTYSPDNSKCVVKLLHLSAVDSNAHAEAQSCFEQTVDRFQQLSDLEAVPRVLDCSTRERDFCFVREFIPGQPFSAVMPLGRRWPEARVVRLLYEGLRLLETIHSRGVLHCSIRPERLIWRQDERLALVSFESVPLQQVQAISAAEPFALPKDDFTAPEQEEGIAEASSDLYALGLVGIQALTGLSPSQMPRDQRGNVIWRDRLPVERGIGDLVLPMRFVGDDDMEAVWQDGMRVSQELVTILTQMVRRDRAERYPTATEALQSMFQLISPNLLTEPQADRLIPANTNGAQPMALPASLPTPGTSPERVLPLAAREVIATGESAFEKQQAIPNHSSPPLPPLPSQLPSREAPESEAAHLIDELVLGQAQLPASPERSAALHPLLDAEADLTDFANQFNRQQPAPESNQQLLPETNRRSPFTFQVGVAAAVVAALLGLGYGAKQFFSRPPQPANLAQPSSSELPASVTPTSQDSTLPTAEGVPSPSGPNVPSSVNPGSSLPTSAIERPGAGNDGLTPNSVTPNGAPPNGSTTNGAGSNGIPSIGVTGNLAANPSAAADRGTIARLVEELERSGTIVLSQGESSENVSKIQRILQLKGYNVGWIDGIYGEQTAEAVSQFQRDRGLSPVDGVIGPATFKALRQSPSSQ
jgi:serine/threonine-protein kinase